MHRCLQLAQKGSGYVAPNPLVGAVLVYEDTIIGEGFHNLFGKEHAEVNCIASVSKENQKLIPLSTLYVSLEPCSHHGKTPPCVDLIIQQKIKNVVIGCKDPFEKVNGRGIQTLIENGITVKESVLENECKEMNKRFFTFHGQKRPYIILKWAQTKNGVIGNEGNDRLIITNEITNRVVHQWRASEAGIMVGKNTVLKDNPYLNVRHVTGKNPIRIVTDRNLEIDENYNLFKSAGSVIVLNTKKNEEKGNTRLFKLDDMQFKLKPMLDALYNLQVQSILVEGGASLLQSFIGESLWDEIRKIENQQIDNIHGIKGPLIEHTRLIKKENYLTDTIFYYQPIKK